MEKKKKKKENKKYKKGHSVRQTFNSGINKNHYFVFYWLVVSWSGFIDTKICLRVFNGFVASQRWASVTEESASYRLTEVLLFSLNLLLILEWTDALPDLSPDPVLAQPQLKVCPRTQRRAVRMETGKKRRKCEAASKRGVTNQKQMLRHVNQHFESEQKRSRAPVFTLILYCPGGNRGTAVQTKSPLRSRMLSHFLIHMVITVE